MLLIYILVMCSAYSWLFLLFIILKDIFADT